MQSVTTERNFILGPEISWPKDFPELKLIDDALRCGICYDYIKTCMVTPCAHSYCSICIRRSLLYKTACPTCFEETFETNLRNNRVLDRITELYVHIRDKLIKHLKIAAIHFDCSEQIQSPLPSQNLISQKSGIPDATPKRPTQKLHKSSTKGKLNFTSTITASSSGKKSDISKRLEDILGSPAPNDPVNNEIDSLGLSIENEFSKVPTVPSMFLQPKVEIQPRTVDIPVVVCPVCKVSIPERNINAHLDNCLANSHKSPVKSPVKMKPKRNPLPKMVWSLMAEKDLRKKLKDYGLNTQGEKKVLISRLQRYILLFNSECDSDNPRPVSEIIRQVEREEKQVPNQNQQRLVINKKSDPKVIEEENKKYIQDNKDSFKKLIEAMKEREGHNIRPLRPSNRILSDDEDIISDEKLGEVPSQTSELPTTSRIVGESIDLCNSNDDRSSSPVLSSWVSADNKICNGFTSDSSQQSNIFQPSKSKLLDGKKDDSKIEYIPCDDQEQSNKIQKSTPEPNNSSPNSRKEFLRSSSSSPLASRSPSPSCIITAHTSDSNDSISILINQNLEENFPENAIDTNKDIIPGVNSQLDDPDFVVDTEDQIDNYSEDIFLTRRKSKRKLKNPIVPDCKENPSPRRTRRRLNK